MKHLKSNLSEEDKALFRQAVKQLSIQNPQNPLEKPRWDLSDTFQDDIGAETVLFYCRSSLPAQRLRAFKKGQLQIEGRLDLHGMTRAEAKEALIHFILRQTEQNHRVCIVIHGKGGQPAILKTQVNHWLPQVPNVLAFTSARPQDGGTGAVYVLLKGRSA